MEPIEDETMPPLEPSVLPTKSSTANTRLVAIGVMVTLVLVSFVAGAAFEKLELHSGSGRGPDGTQMGSRGGPGGPGGRGGPRGGRGGPRPLQDMLPDSLKLTAKQSEAVDSAMSMQLRALDTARVAFQPRLDSILRQTRARIDSILTPAQRAALPALRDDGFIPGFGPGDRRGGRGDRDGRGGPDRHGGFGPPDDRGPPDGRGGPPRGRGPDGGPPPRNDGSRGGPPDRGAPPAGGNSPTFDHFTGNEK